VARLISIDPLPHEGEGLGENARSRLDSKASSLVSVTGALDARIGAAGARVRAKAPLELRGPFPGASYYLRNTTAGVFGGDVYEVDVTSAAGSTVRVASGSATKVYAGNGCQSSLAVRLTVEPGATLLWGPHATIVQAGASYRQATAVSVARGGRALVGEVLVLGRLAYGERFDFQRIESRLTVTLDGAPVYNEAYSLRPGRDLVASMARRAVLASVHAIGFEATEAAPQLERALAGESLAGWSELPNGAGLVVRGLCDALSAGQDLVERVMALGVRSDR